MIPLAASGSGGDVAYAVGVSIGGVICAGVLRRGLRNPDATGLDGKPLTDVEKRLAYQVVAALFTAMSLICLIIALVVGETAFIIWSAVNLAVAAASLVRFGLPRGWLQHYAAIWRR